MEQTPQSHLWRHGGFVRLWSALTISRLGSEITFLALPLTAITLLNATPVQMGVLSSLGTLPYLLIGLPAGVWVDRFPRRQMLIVAEIVRALALLTVPAAALLHGLTMAQLYVVAFLVGVMTTLADVAEEAFLPALIGREQLVEGYSKLAASTAVVEIAGPGAAGLILQILSAPLAVMIDALTYVISVLLLRSIRVTEPAPSKPHASGLRPFIGDMIEGMSYLLRHHLLRPMMLSASTIQFFGGMFDALFILYLSDEVGLSPAAIGALYLAGISGLIAAATGQRVVRALGAGPSFIVAGFMIEAGLFITGLANGPALVIFVTIFAARIVQGLGNTWFNITYSSIFQAVTPDPLLGRVNASEQFFGMGILPIGALVGGFLGARLGLHNTLLLAGAGSLLATGWVLLSPLRRLKVPAPAPDAQ